MNVLLSTAYWPNLHYFYYVLNSNTITIDVFENYQKQTYRNRTQILSANGKLDLIIPIKNRNTKQLIKDTEISYTGNWQHNHWQAIISAYKKSPFFDFFESDITNFYKKKYDFLIDYNTEQLKLILKLLRQKKEFSFSKEHEKESVLITDLRYHNRVKAAYTNDENVINCLTQSYYQTFQNKFEFQPNLSILDLLFNTGLNTIDYLKLKDNH